jgi:hypothetical protein
VATVKSFACLSVFYSLENINIAFLCQDHKILMIGKCFIIFSDAVQTAEYRFQVINHFATSFKKPILQDSRFCI